MVEETTSRFDAGVSKRPPVRLVVWLTHPDVECWNFSAHHEALLERELGGAVDVEVCQSRSELLEALSDAQVALVWEFEDEWL
ncbi:MAG TPA: hypothetical protein VK116_16110, partial [Planctomycetota bacterium]|nr:hypothetical protein [Planctomycetota bacterium]